EDVIADRSNALGVPRGRNISRVEKERIAGNRVLEVLIDDFRDGDGGLPLLVGMLHVRQRVSADERELPALEEHAAIGAGEAAAALRTVRDHPSDGKLPSKRLAL